MIFRTERLCFREITAADFPDVASVLMDDEVMYAWEGGFSAEQTRQWMDRTIGRYAELGYGHWFVEDARTGEFIGLIGIIREVVDDAPYFGLGYMLKKEHWGKGYAMEGAKSCLEYAFDVLDADRVIAEIRPENVSSRKLAERLGMSAQKEIMKNYNGKNMPHLVYSVTKEDYRRGI